MVGLTFLMSVPSITVSVEVEMNKENQSTIGWVLAIVMAVLAWFLGGVISAGTGRKRGH